MEGEDRQPSSSSHPHTCAVAGTHLRSQLGKKKECRVFMSGISFSDQCNHSYQQSQALNARSVWEKNVFTRTFFNSKFYSGTLSSLVERLSIHLSLHHSTERRGRKEREREGGRGRDKGEGGGERERERRKEERK